MGRHDKDKAWAWHALFNNGSKATMSAFAKAYGDMTRAMIEDWSYTLDGAPGTCVDIVCNVINLASVHWITDYLVRLPFLFSPSALVLT